MATRKERRQRSVGNSSSGFSSSQLKEIRKIVNRDLQGDLELKHFETVTTGYNFDSDISDTTEAGFILGGMSANIYDSNRIGDKIRLKRIVSKGCVSLPLGVGFLNAVITVMILSCKSAPAATATTMPWTSLLQTNASSEAWTGLVRNRMQVINDEEFTLHARKDIPLSFMYSTTATQSVLSAGGKEGGIPFADFEFDLPFDRVVSYDAGLTIPSTFNPFIVFAITSGDSQVTSVYGGTGYATVWNTAWYTDA